MVVALGRAAAAKDVWGGFGFETATALADVPLVPVILFSLMVLGCAFVGSVIGSTLRYGTPFLHTVGGAMLSALLLFLAIGA